MGKLEYAVSQQQHNFATERSPGRKKKFRLKLRFSGNMHNSRPETRVKMENLPAQESLLYNPDYSYTTFQHPILQEAVPEACIKEEARLFIKPEAPPVQRPHYIPPMPQFAPMVKLSPMLMTDNPVEFPPAIHGLSEARMDSYLNDVWSRSYGDEDPAYCPNSDFSFTTSDDESFQSSGDIFNVQNVNPSMELTKVRSRKERKHKKKKKPPRRRYKRRILTDGEKLQASRKRRTCLVKKPKSQYLGVSWCNTKNTWVARVWHPTERKLIWAGYHQNERACALAVNEKCLDLHIPLKNPQIMQVSF